MPMICCQNSSCVTSANSCVISSNCHCLSYACPFLIDIRWSYISSSWVSSGTRTLSDVAWDVETCSSPGVLFFQHGSPMTALLHALDPLVEVLVVKTIHLPFNSLHCNFGSSIFLNPKANNEHHHKCFQEWQGCDDHYGAKKGALKKSEQWQEAGVPWLGTLDCCGSIITCLHWQWPAAAGVQNAVSCIWWWLLAAAAIKKISKNIKRRKCTMGVVSFFEAQNLGMFMKIWISYTLMLVLNEQKIKLYTSSLSYKTHNPKGVAGAQQTRKKALPTMKIVSKQLLH